MAYDYYTKCLSIGYIIYVTQDAPITQEIAVSVTEQALVKAGIDVKKMMPNRYKADNLFKPSETEKLFSRDPHDPNNSGYVIWKGIDGAIYKVGIKRSTNKIECKITFIKNASPKLSKCADSFNKQDIRALPVQVMICL